MAGSRFAHPRDSMIDKQIHRQDQAKQQILDFVSEILGDMNGVTIDRSRDVDIRPDFDSDNFCVAIVTPGPNEQTLIEGKNFTIEIRKGPFAKTCYDIEGGKLVQQD